MEHPHWHVPQLVNMYGFRTCIMSPSLPNTESSSWGGTTTDAAVLPTVVRRRQDFSSSRAMSVADVGQHCTSRRGLAVCRPLIPGKTKDSG